MLCRQFKGHSSKKYFFIAVLCHKLTAGEKGICAKNILRLFMLQIK